MASLSLRMRDVITRFWCGLLDEDQVSAALGTTRIHRSAGAGCASCLPFARQTLRRTLTLVLQRK